MTRHSYEPVKVARAGRREERVHDRALLWQAHDGGARPCLPYLAAGPAGQLPGRLLRSVDKLPDHAERHAEHVVQYECHALSRCQGVQHDHERQPD